MASMGEFELLARIRERLPAAGERLRLGSGDDAAIAVPGGATATSVDAVVEGVHFTREHAELSQIGHKALATALSDLAAMGAEPGEAYVFLGVPADLDEDGCLELLDGLLALATETGTAVAGGDLARAAALTVVTTVVGHGPGPESFVTRAGGRPDDVLAVTGSLGAAAAGLALLEAPELGVQLSASTKGALCARQLEPMPRLAAGRALGSAGATAMIDLSDGLGGDLGHMAAASGCGAVVEAASLPLADGLEAVARAADRDPLELAVAGGEDYELLAALPAERFGDAKATLARLDVTLTRIGELTAGEGVEVRRPAGGRLEATGFDQLG
jgi:thiamine-monophosphate kinase